MTQTTTASTTPAATRRGFRMHPSLLADVIKKQTGSLDRAVQEAVSNSIDAGATAVHVRATTTKVTVTDDGRGFQTEDEVRDNFETFGQPHAVSEAKVFGQFRMGRGQLFAHGRNTWRTNAFCLKVDIERPAQGEDALGYELAAQDPPVRGCEVAVELYRPMTHAQLVELEEQAKRAFRWVTTPVYFNGHRVSTDPHDRDWPDAGDFFVAHFDLTSQLHLYNLGVHVKSYPRAAFNVGGTVVSTAAMQLTFSRTEPMDVCPVWRSVRDRLPDASAACWAAAKRAEEAEAKKARKGKGGGDFSRLQEIPRLSVVERQKRLKEVVAAGRPVDAKYDFGQPLLVAHATTRAWLSVRRLVKLAKSTGHKVAFSDCLGGSATTRRAERLGLCTYLAAENLRTAGVPDDPAAFCRQLNRAFGTGLVAATGDEVERAIQRHEVAVRKEGVSAAERAVLDAVSGAAFGHLSRSVEAVLAVLGDPERQVKLVETAGAYRPTALLGRDLVGRLLDHGDLKDWSDLGFALLKACAEHEASQGDDDAPEGETEREAGDRRGRAVLKTLLGHAGGVHGFARSCVEHLTQARDALSAEQRKVQAAVTDALQRYQASGENMALWRASLAEARDRVDGVLREWELSAGLTEEEAA